jgi:hypothetical protein
MKVAFIIGMTWALVTFVLLVLNYRFHQHITVRPQSSLGHKPLTPEAVIHNNRYCAAKLTLRVVR